jgi:RNA polymerase sigma factor (sigma-70 family)
MVNGSPARAAMQVARMFRDGTLAGMSDRQVLERFITNRDESAFEAILYRHGAMVRNVCRQMLFDPHDVDDAVQAVFLVLVRKAKFIRIEGSLGPWLYSVAGRVAARARANRRTRWARECQTREIPDASYSSTEDACEIPRVLHDELGRLPERLRAPLVLCYLEGMTHDLAARQLDCPVGTVRSRLARARSLLHRRITRRGITLSTAALGALLESNARAAVSFRLPGVLVDSIRGAALETVLHTGMGTFTSFTTILKGVLSVSQFKKIAILATAISVGGVASMVVGRTTAGQTPKQESRKGQVLDGPIAVDSNDDRPVTSASPEPKKDPRLLAIESKLNERISINVAEQPLSGAVGFLQNYTGVNIVLDPKALSEAGVTASSPVSLSVKQVPFKTVLKLLLGPLGLAYKLEEEVILITSPQGAAPALGTKATYAKSYYVGDLVGSEDAVRQRILTGPASGKQLLVDLKPMMDLIQMTVARGTWNVQDGYGNELPPKVSTRATDRGNRQNAMVPFFLSISLIIKCPEETHAEVADLLRALRRLKFGSEREDKPLTANELRRTQPASSAAEVEKLHSSQADRRKRIDQLLKELRLLNAPGDSSVLEANAVKREHVANAPDVDVVVSESKRVIGVSGTTMFEIGLANHGTKAATNLMLAAELSRNLEFQAVAGTPKGVDVAVSQSKDALKFSQIDKLEPGKVMVFGFYVKAVGATPRLATCKAVVTHDDLPDTIEDVAGVKVMTRLPAALGSDDRILR